MRPIDADKLKPDMEEKVFCGDGTVKIFGVSMHQIDAAPTISLPPNDPLTLEDLREMDGEPVWTVTLSVEGSGRWELCTCEVVTACPLHKVLRCVTATGEVTDYELDTYSKTWQAYRRKPEEADNETD